MAHTHKCCQMQKLKRGLWSPDEDERLLAYVMQYGPGSWCSVPSIAGIQRCGKSCRLRWMNYLRPNLKHGSFSSLEKTRIIELHAIYGNRWSKIASHLPGRTDNEIKNLWNSSLRKRKERKTAQRSTKNAHEAACTLEEAGSVLRPCHTSTARPPCILQSRPIFPFSVHNMNSQECEERNADVSNLNQTSVNEDLIISGHASLQETLRGRDLTMNQNEFLGRRPYIMPRHEMSQFDTVKLAQSPGDNYRLQMQESEEQMVMVISAPCSAPNSLHCRTPSYVSTQLQYVAAREVLAWSDYGANEAYRFGVNHDDCDYLSSPTADYYNSTTHDGGVRSQHELTAGNYGGPCSAHQREPGSQSPSNACSHELGRMGQSPSTTCSEDSSASFTSFFDYDDAHFCWLQDATYDGLC